jgi:adenylate kinase
MQVICVTGTPGTGKTTVAKKIAREKGYVYLDVKELIKKNNLAERKDKKRGCVIVDEKKLVRLLSKIIKESQDKGIVIDSHLSHYLSSKLVDLCVVTKCDITVLNKRLLKRKYPAKKRRENLDAEIFSICLLEAVDKGHNVKVVDTTD